MDVNTSVQGTSDLCQIRQIPHSRGTARIKAMQIRKGKFRESEIRLDSIAT